MKEFEKKLEKLYFNKELSRGFLLLITARTIVYIAIGLVGLFLPIFLYELFNYNFQYMVLYFGIGYLLYALFVPIGAKFLNYFGFVILDLEFNK